MLYEYDEKELKNQNPKGRVVPLLLFRQKLKDVRIMVGVDVKDKGEENIPT